MGVIRATLTAVPNGTVVSITGESNLTYFLGSDRATGMNGLIPPPISTTPATQQATVAADFGPGSVAGISSLMRGQAPWDQAAVITSFFGRSSPFSVDYYFWFPGGTDFTWAVDSSNPSTTGVGYNAGTHGLMAKGQLYKLSAAFPASAVELLGENYTDASGLVYNSRITEKFTIRAACLVGTGTAQAACRLLTLTS